jgi:hypothetical protein
MRCDATREAVHERLLQFVLDCLHDSNWYEGSRKHVSYRLMLVEPLIERSIDVNGHG